MPQIIVYPDADPETSSVDGYVGGGTGGIGSGVDWSVIRVASGAVKDDTGNYNFVNFTSDNVADKWIRLDNGIILFDTSVIPIGAEIRSATLYLYGTGIKVNGLNLSSKFNIYSADPSSNIALVDGDYSSLGITPFCNSPINYANWSTIGYNAFILNANGLAAIIREGITKFSIREVVYDVGGTVPVWSDTNSMTISFWQSDKGVGYKPKLLVQVGGEGLGASNIVTLEALRNLEMAGQGRLYIDDEGNAKYESRFHRSM